MAHNSVEFPVWKSVGEALPDLQIECERSIVKRAKIRSMVAHALAENRICLVYQPVVSCHAGRPVSFYEGLMRIRDTDGSLLPPGSYLPYVAGTALGTELDLAVLELAITKLEANPWLRLAINVAPTTTACADWMRRLRAAATKAPDIAYRLIVEITESSDLTRHDTARGFIEDLHRIGASVALDDFGAGPTSFRYFQEFRFDIVKIDGSYCRGLADNPHNMVLVKALVDIARHFEMLTVAEFIETECDSASVTALGVDCLQGYFTGRPSERLSCPSPAW